jgi:hypothetical protein
VTASGDIVEDLLLARALLAVHGRAVGDFEDDDGRICLVAATARATVGNDDAFTEVNSLLCRHLPPRADQQALSDRERMWTFNDDKRTTDQDVYHLIDKALADLGGLG